MYLKVSQSLAILHPLSNGLYIKIVRIHNKQLNDKRSNVRHAGETCRTSPNFGDRCQKHRGAPRESADKSYRRGVMRIQYTASPTISPMLSSARQKKKRTMETTPEGCYGSSTTKARRNDATTSDATCGVSLPRPFANTGNHRLAFQSNGTKRTRLHNLP